MSARVLVVAVSYFGSPDLRRLIESLAASSQPDWRLVTVDNAEDSAEWTKVADAVAVDSRAEGIRSPRNLGFFGGARHALKDVDPTAFDWVVVSNADICFAPDFIARLGERRPDCVVAPSITSSITGRDQNPYLRERPGGWAVRRWRWEFALVPVGRIVVALGNSRLSRRGGPPGTEAANIYAPHGSCMALPREFFARGGSLNHEPFLFAEEITIAEQCRRLGMTVVYDPTVRVRHREHASTGVLRSARMIRWQRDAIGYAARLLDDQRRGR